MLRYEIIPRSSETNATGHIDHTVLPIWFELARTPVYRIFNPDLSFAAWNTVIRNLAIDYLGEVFHDRETEVRTTIGAIRTTSFTVEQELWQNAALVARAQTVLVYFDYANRAKQNISARLREELLALNTR